MLLTDEADFASDLLHPGNVALVQDAPAALERLDICQDMFIAWLPAASPAKLIDDTIIFLSNFEARIPRSVAQDYDMRKRPLPPRKF